MKAQSMYRVSAFLLIIVLAVPAFAQFELMWGENNPAGMDNIHGVTVNPENGDIFIVHFGDRNIRHFDSEMDHIETFDLDIGEVRGLGFDTRENQLIVANGGNFAIISLEGEVLRTIQGGGGGINTMSYDPEEDQYIVGYWDRQVAFYSREGERVDGFNVNVNITGICYYPINRSIFVLDTNDPVLEFSMDGEQIGTPLEGDQIDDNGQDLGYDPMQRILYATGQMAWLGAFEDNYGPLPEPELDPEGFEVAISLGLDGEETLTIANVGEEESILRFSLEDVGDDPDWLEINPTSGTVEEGDDPAEITLIFTTEELEPNIYNRTVLVHTNNPEFNEVEIPFELTVISGYGELLGTVIDADTEDPVEGAVISIPRFDFERVTDEEGNYHFDEIPEWVYTIILTAEDYHSQVAEDVEVVEDEVTRLDFELLHSVCGLSVDSVDIAVGPDEDARSEFRMTNPGNGPLIWSVEKTFPDAPDVDPWGLVGEHDVEEVVNDNSINGITFADGHFYVSGGNNGEDVNKIYIFDIEGNNIGEFDQFNESYYGMRDLTYDGSLMWGADETTLYGFNTDGELIESIEGSARSYRTLTWDADHNLFWSANITSSIYATDLNGELVDEIEVPEGFRNYGLGYWPGDPDGCNLYVFSRGAETDIQANKVNLDNGEWAVAAAFDMDGSGPGGVHITNSLNPYAWIMIAIVQGPDRMAGWVLDINREWVEVDPEADELEAQGGEDVILTFDATGIPAEVILESDLVFHHNGVGSETVLSVSMEVSEGQIHTTRQVHFEIGWNLVSINLQPDDEDVEVVMAELVEADLLVMMKDGSGHFYRPEHGFNNIPGWFVDQGYQVLMANDALLNLTGVTVSADSAIELEDGWQIVSYYPRDPIEATVALSGIVDHLVIAKEGHGNFYVPAWNFSNMGDMCEGQGYYLKIDCEDPVELVYRTEMEDDRASTAYRSISVYDQSGLLPLHPVTGVNMSLLVVADPSLTGEVGVYTNGDLVGSGVLQNGVCGIAVWGDDPSTESIDGALESQPLEIKLFDGDGLYDVEFDVLSGDAVYETDALAVIRLAGSAEIPSEFGIVSAYPNPFNGQLRIDFVTCETNNVSLKVYDLSGREVETLVSGRLVEGLHRLQWDADMLPTGVYVLRLTANNHTQTNKVVLVR